MTRIVKLLSPILIFVVIICFPMAGYPQTRRPDVHFEATPQEVVEAMLKMAGVNREDVVYDLGCGDGRFVITAAKAFGARGVGIDIDPVRIKESNENAKNAGVADRVTFRVGDLFKADIREATVVALYLLNELNLDLRPKLFRELKPRTRIVSYTFDMSDWEPDNMGKVRGRTFYYWVIPADISGTWQWSLPSPNDFWQKDLILQQDFQDIAGRVGFQGRQFRMREPRLIGNQLSFRLRYNDEGQDVALRFNGHAHEDTIEGTVDIQGGPREGTHKWTAKRIKK